MKKNDNLENQLRDILQSKFETLDRCQGFMFVNELGDGLNSINSWLAADNCECYSNIPNLAININPYTYINTPRRAIET